MTDLELTKPGLIEEEDNINAYGGDNCGGGCGDLDW